MPPLTLKHPQLGNIGKRDTAARSPLALPHDDDQPNHYTRFTKQKKLKHYGVQPCNSVLRHCVTLSLLCTQIEREYGRERERYHRKCLTKTHDTGSAGKNKGTLRFKKKEVCHNSLTCFAYYLITCQPCTSSFSMLPLAQ